MKSTNTIITLLVILFSALLIGMVGFESSKEGITYNELTVLKDILKNTNSTNMDSNMDSIKSMNIEDTDFSIIINNKSLSNAKKVTQLNLMAGLLVDNNLSGKTYEDAWDDNVNL